MRYCLWLFPFVKLTIFTCVLIFWIKISTNFAPSLMIIIFLLVVPQANTILPLLSYPSWLLSLYIKLFISFFPIPFPCLMMPLHCFYTLVSFLSIIFHDLRPLNLSIRLASSCTSASLPLEILLKLLLLPFI